MDWLAQNWIWIALGIGAIFFMTRAGGMGGCGMGHSGAHHSDHGGHDDAPPAAGNRPGNLLDPVSGRTFAAGNAPVSTVYRGRAYYFESREYRDTFEANPEQFLTGAAAGQASGSANDHGERRRRRGGC